MHSNVLSRETSCPETYPNNSNQQFTELLGTGNENWQEYHIYGAWIKSPLEVVLFLDGRQWKTITPSTPFDSQKMYVTMSSNLYSWNRGLNSNPDDDKVDPQFIVNIDGKNYFDTVADETTEEGRDERSAHFDWVRCWQLEDE